MNKSKCCNTALKTINEDEGTCWNQCTKCLKDSDPKQPEAKEDGKIGISDNSLDKPKSSDEGKCG